MNKEKLAKLKEKYGFDKDPVDVSKKKITAKDELKEIYVSSKTQGNLIKGLLLSPLFAYFSNIISIFFDSFPIIDLNVEDDKTVIILHHIKMLLSVIIIFISYYSLTHRIKRQPVRLLFVIILSLISVFMVIGTLISKVKKINKEKKEMTGSDYFNIGTTSISLLISIGFSIYSLFLYFGQDIRFVNQNMYVLIAKMVLSVIYSLSAIYDRI